MDITIAVPTLNSAITLPWTLLSLQSQEGCEVEIIVVDSGSTDGTLEICEQFKVKMIYEPPGNMYRAINAGLRIASARWLGYLNSDDMIYPRSYARLIKAGLAKHADIVYGSCDFIDRENRFLFSYFPGKPHELLAQFRSSQLSFAQPAAIFRSEVFSQLSGFDEQYNLSADHDFFWRALLNKFNFIQLNEPPVACFRISSNQLSQNKERTFQEVASIRDKNGHPHTLDYIDTLRWRTRNAPQYILRQLRRVLITGKFTLARTLDPLDEN